MLSRVLLVLAGALVGVACGSVAGLIQRWTSRKPISPRRPSRYLFGASVMAEWTEEDDWSFYELRRSNDGAYTVESLEFIVEANDESAKTVLAWIDQQIATRETERELRRTA